MKTKFGITAGALTAIAYLAGFFSGYTVLALIVGYVFIVEDNDWLKINTLKALFVTLCFDIILALIGFIPNLITLINSLVRIWDDGITGYKAIAGISNTITFIQNLINIIEKVVILLLALLATKLKTIKIGFIDSIIEKVIVKAA